MGTATEERLAELWRHSVCTGEKVFFSYLFIIVFYIRAQKSLQLFIFFAFFLHNEKKSRENRNTRNTKFPHNIWFSRVHRFFPIFTVSIKLIHMDHLHKNIKNPKAKWSSRRGTGMCLGKIIQEFSFAVRWQKSKFKCVGSSWKFNTLDFSMELSWC